MVYKLIGVFAGLFRKNGEAPKVAFIHPERRWTGNLFCTVIRDDLFLRSVLQTFQREITK